jgi:ECF sigma factor
MPAGQETGTTRPEVTRLLIAWREGDEQAPGELFTVLYKELRALAHAQLRRRQQQSLATTALVHEAYLKLADQSRLDLRDRGHFLALAARAMRQIVVDHARRRTAGKRGGTAIVGRRPGAGRSPDPPRGRGAAPLPHRRHALLRRVLRGGDRPGPGSVRTNGEARLAEGAGVSVRGAASRHALARLGLIRATAGALRSLWIPGRRPPAWRGAGRKPCRD